MDYEQDKTAGAQDGPKEAGGTAPEYKAGEGGPLASEPGREAVLKEAGGPRDAEGQALPAGSGAAFEEGLKQTETGPAREEGMPEPGAESQSQPPSPAQALQPEAPSEEPYGREKEASGGSFSQASQSEAVVINSGPAQDGANGQRPGWDGQSQTQETKQEPESNGAMSMAALVMGILSLLCCCCGYVGVVFGALGIIFALLSRQNGPMCGRAKTGLILSAIGLVISVISMVMWLLWMAIVEFWG